jgi:hypothetical protein
MYTVPVAWAVLTVHGGSKNEELIIKTERKILF